MMQVTMMISPPTQQTGATNERSPPDRSRAASVSETNTWGYPNNNRPIISSTGADKNRICYICASPKHIAPQCPVRLYGPPEAEATMNSKDIEYKRQHGLCFYCSQKGHLKKECPTRPTNRDRSASREPKPKIESTEINTRVVTVKPMPKIAAQKVYLDFEVNGFKTLGLVDTGCDKSLIPFKRVEGVELEALDLQLYAANRTNIEIL